MNNMNLEQIRVHRNSK